MKHFYPVWIILAVALLGNGSIARPETPPGAPQDTTVSTSSATSPATPPTLGDGKKQGKSDEQSSANPTQPNVANPVSSQTETANANGDQNPSDEETKKNKPVESNATVKAGEGVENKDIGKKLNDSVNNATPTNTEGISSPVSASSGHVTPAPAAKSTVPFSVTTEGFPTPELVFPKNKSQPATKQVYDEILGTIKTSTEKIPSETVDMNTKTHYNGSFDVDHTPKEIAAEPTEKHGLPEKLFPNYHKPEGGSDKHGLPEKVFPKETMQQDSNQSTDSSEESKENANRKKIRGLLEVCGQLEAFNKEIPTDPNIQAWYQDSTRYLQFACTELKNQVKSGMAKPRN